MKEEERRRKESKGEREEETKEKKGEEWKEEEEEEKKKWERKKNMASSRIYTRSTWKCWQGGIGSYGNSLGIFFVGVGWNETLGRGSLEAGWVVESFFHLIAVPQGLETAFSLSLFSPSLIYLHFF